MRFSPRWAVRALVAVAVFVTAVVAWAGPSLAELPGTEVTIVRPDGKIKFAWIGQTSPDIDTTYKLRRRGQPDQDIKIESGDGVSLWKLLNKARADLGYSAISIKSPSGRPLTFTEKQVRGPFGPLFYVDDTGQLFFFRPSSGSNDYNAGDRFPITTSAVQFEQEKTELDVGLKASDTEVEVGDSVKFTASVNPSGDYRYDWGVPGTKDKGVFRSGSTITRTFTKAGSYNVTVGVKIGSATSNSDSASVRIQVGDPKESHADQTGGGDNGAAGAPDSGPSTGSSGVGSDTYTPVTPSPTPPTPTPSPDPPSPPDIATSGPTISGNLLADASDPPATSALQSAVKAAREGTPKDDEPEEASVSTAALGIAGLFGLLALGAGLELRHGGTRSGRRRLRLRLPRRGA